MDLTAFLETLPLPSLRGLYASPSACVAVLRGLPPLAREYAWRLLHAGSAPRAAVDAWPAPGAASSHDAALAKLERLQVVEVTGVAADGLALLPAFRAGVAAAAATGRPPRDDAVPAAATAAFPSPSALAAHVEAQWDGLLLYLAGERDGPPRAPPGVAGVLGTAPTLDPGALLAVGGYVAPVAGGGGRRGRGATVTPAGLALLLATTHHQLWALLREYCSRAGAELSLADTVGLLLRLASAPRGTPVAAAGLAPAAAAAAADACALGLALPYAAAGGAWLAPTSLADALRGAARRVAGGGGGAANAGTGRRIPRPTPDRCVIVETTFQVYALTSSRVRRAALAVFAAPLYAAPGVAAFKVTRASVLAALDRGVPVDAMVAHLRDHAAPHVAHRTPAVPPTVTDMMHLWASGRARVACTPCVLFADFDGSAAYEAARAAAAAAGGLLWCDAEGGGRLAAAPAADEAVRAAIRAARNAAG